MPMSTALAEAGILRAEEIAMLSHIYEEITTSPRYLGDKPTREALARKILRLYESGVIDPNEIKRYCST